MERNASPLATMRASQQKFCVSTDDHGLNIKAFLNTSNGQKYSMLMFGASPKSNIRDWLRLWAYDYERSVLGGTTINEGGTILCHTH